MIVAITGIILILFVIGHLLGNLQIFLGPDWINSYSRASARSWPTAMVDPHFSARHRYRSYLRDHPIGN